MSWARPLSVCLMAFLSALAAAADFEKSLPNDTDAVVVVNVRQIAGAQAFQRHYLTPIQEYLKETGEVQQALASIGLDPVKDIDWIVLANGDSLYKAEKKIVGGKAVVDYQASLFVLVEGRFNAAQVRGWAEKFAKSNPQVLKIQPAGKSQIYQLEVGRTIYAAQLGPTVIALSLTREPILEALDRSAGKTKAAPRYRELVAAIPKLDPKRSVHFLALGNMVYGKDIDVLKVGNKFVERPATLTLASSGIDAVSGSITLVDDLTADIHVAVKDAATGKAVAESLQKDQTATVEVAFAAALKYKLVAPLFDLVKAIKTDAPTARMVQIRAAVSADELAKSLK